MKGKRAMITGLVATACVLLGVAVVATRGCGRMEQEFKSAEKMMRLALGIGAYANAHDGKYPDKLDDVKEYCEYHLLITNPVTGDNPGYEYVKPQEDAPPGTILLYQLRDGKRDLDLKVTLLDGSVGVGK